MWYVISVRGGGAGNRYHQRFISEGVQILQYYSEVHGPGGPNTSKYLDRGEPFLGGPFFSWQGTHLSGKQLDLFSGSLPRTRTTLNSAGGSWSRLRTMAKSLKTEGTLGGEPGVIGQSNPESRFNTATLCTALEPASDCTGEK